MARYILRKEAQNDLRKIGRYTTKRWGVKQRNNYLRQLADRFSWLAENPKLGKKRYTIKEGHFSYSEGRHIIFYLTKDNCVDLIRILHNQMDIEHIFNDIENVK